VLTAEAARNLTASKLRLSFLVLKVPRVAVYCIVLLCVAVCCCVLLCVAVCCCGFASFNLIPQGTTIEISVWWCISIPSFGASIQLLVRKCNYCLDSNLV